MTSNDSGNAPAVHVDRVAIKPPPFWRADPALWFVQLEAQFDLAKITVDDTKYNYVVSAVDTEILSQITDFLNTPPANNKYLLIKSKLISIFGESRESQMRRLLCDISLGDKKPSQLLNEMARLGGSAVTQELLKSLWLQHLPGQMQVTLLANNGPLGELAKLADRIAEVQPQDRVHAVKQEMEVLSDSVAQLAQQVAAMNTGPYKPDWKYRGDRRTTRSEKPSAAGSVCWFHQKFGVKARRCISPLISGAERRIFR
ncbi:hypothetical protein ABEB36_013968 [Hypothenemus hampei]|uniref:DUF7041 domain-containing protein n=1 Tax=Hypothenemus hampei TaxID=57062 RepID=A0ABD1E2W6_HYPHA